MGDQIRTDNALALGWRKRGKRGKSELEIEIMTEINAKTARVAGASERNQA